MRPDELQGEARELFETWRRLGLPERAALDEVRRADLGPELGAFDQMVGLFESLGLGPAEARLAAIGRGRSEREARQVWEAAVPGSAFGSRPVADEPEAEVPDGLVASLVAEVVAEMVRDGVAEDTAHSIVAGVTVDESDASKARTLRRYLDQRRKTTMAEDAAAKEH